MKPLNIKSKNVIFFFLAYCIALLFIVIIKILPDYHMVSVTINGIKENGEMGYWNCNIIPFQTLSYYFSNLSHDYAIQNISANIIAYMPFGIFIPALSKSSSYFSSAVKALIIFISIELFQFVSMTGYFDIDDIILNILGFSFGYLVYKVIKTKMSVVQ